MDIFDTDGNEIGPITLSEKQQALLNAGENIGVLYHTPRMLQGVLGNRTGSFLLTKHGDRLVTAHPASAKDYVQLQKAIKAALGEI